MKVYWKTLTQNWSKPPKNQFPTGSRVYKGFQGSGKSLSMVFYAFELQKQFPNCEIYSNMVIKGLKNFHYIENDSILHEALNATCGSRGVLILLDEAHLYFNKKSGISLDVLTCISQQRKDRKRLVFSSQIWEELDISLRKQVKEIVSCKCFFGKLQVNTISDGETLTYDKLASEYVAKPIRTEIFKHSNLLYQSYDTYQKIITNKNYERAYQAAPPMLEQVSYQNKKSLFTSQKA